MLPRDRQIVERYLARHAEPEARVAVPGVESWSHVLVVPVMDEAQNFLDGYRDALADASGRVLVIIVVNAPAHATARQQTANRALWHALARGGRELADDPTPVHLVHAAASDLLFVDRGAAPRLLPPRQGVGLARKIGLDLALALWAQGRVASSVLAWTDADATLPAGFFERIAAHGDTAVIAAPYRHVCPAGSELERATRAYELWIRYYVLGLHAAGSPFALHTIGSTLSVPALAYARVRGVPKRTAGEDFHIVNKALKVGVGIRLPGEPVRLEARFSERVLFGTGPAVQQIHRSGVGDAGFELLHPQVFAVLGGVLRGVERVARARSTRQLESSIRELPGPARDVVASFFSETRLLHKIEAAVMKCNSSAAAWRRICDNFDALQTLRLLHRLRDAGHGKLPWRDALSQAPFVGRELSDLETARAWAEQAEMALPGRVGPRVS
jgi:hypothetical protein